MYLKENGTLGFYRRDCQDLCMEVGTSYLVKTLRLRLKNLKFGQQVCRDNTNQSNDQWGSTTNLPHNNKEKNEKK